MGVEGKGHNTSQNLGAHVLQTFRGTYTAIISPIRMGLEHKAYQSLGTHTNPPKGTGAQYLRVAEFRDTSPPRSPPIGI